jgi:hypothetical protein
MVSGSSALTLYLTGVRWNRMLTTTNYQRGVLLVISAGAIEGHFEGKNAAGRSPKGSLFLHDNAPAHRAPAA